MDQNRPRHDTNATATSRDVKHLRRLARLLDSAIPLPGGFRIGLDGILGLIPGVGDALGASLSTYIVVQAARLGASPVQLVRMMLNVLLETLIGTIPVLGDLFDFAWKANERNMVLLEAQLQRAPAHGSSRRRLTTASVVLLLGFVVLLVLLIALAVKLVLALVAAVNA